jgi:hypothetical protein
MGQAIIITNFRIQYEGVSVSFRSESITKYMLTLGITRRESIQRVMVAKLTRLAHKIAMQLHLMAECCTICSSSSRRPVRKLLDTSSYVASELVQTGLHPASSTAISPHPPLPQPPPPHLCSSITHKWSRPFRFCKQSFTSLSHSSHSCCKTTASFTEMTSIVWTVNNLKVTSYSTCFKTSSRLLPFIHQWTNSPLTVQGFLRSVRFKCPVMSFALCVS